MTRAFPRSGGEDIEIGTVASPTVEFGTPGDSSFTYTHQELSYIRYGNLVWFFLSIKFDTNAYTTASGLLQCSVLPFAAATPANFDLGFTASGFFSKLTSAATIMFSPYVLPGSSALRFATVNSAGTRTIVTTAKVPASVTDYVISACGIYRKA